MLSHFGWFKYVAIVCFALTYRFWKPTEIVKKFISKSFSETWKNINHLLNSYQQKILFSFQSLAKHHQDEDAWLSVPAFQPGTTDFNPIVYCSWIPTCVNSESSIIGSRQTLLWTDRHEKSAQRWSEPQKNTSWRKTQLNNAKQCLLSESILFSYCRTT